MTGRQTIASRLGITVEEAKARGDRAILRSETETLATNQEKARVTKLTRAQHILLGKVAASEHGLTRSRQDAIYHALMRLAKRGLVDDRLYAGTNTYVFTVTDLGRAVVEANHGS